MTQDNQGYTIIEMMLVLFMVMILIGFPTLKLKNWEEQYSVQTFINKLEKNIIRAQHAAIFSESSSTMTVSKYNEFVEISYENAQNVSVKELLKYPKGVTTPTAINLAFNGTSGNNQKIEKFTLVDEINQRKITYQLQMGSGKFVKKTEKK